MKQGTWRAAFTIVLDGQQIDLLELSSIHAGSTEGELYELEEGEKMES